MKFIMKKILPHEAAGYTTVNSFAIIIAHPVIEK